jgi:hypothetical protein
MFAQIGSPEELKGSGQYLVLTPEECLSHAANSSTVRFRPLVGGIDPDIAWESLHLFEAKVLPHLDVEKP